MCKIAIDLGQLPTSPAKLCCCCCNCCDCCESFACCCFNYMTCLNKAFLKSEVAFIKAIEIILSMLCQSIAFKTGFAFVATLGTSYLAFITTVTWCFMTTSILFICYTFSQRTYGLIRQSLFEVIFHVTAAFSYFSSSSYLGLLVKMLLYPQFIMSSDTGAYPEMSLACMLGIFLGFVHLFDLYKSYTYYKSFR